MISPTALAKYGNKDIAFNPVGTGPFKFVEWKQTDYLKVVKNDNYWRKGLPKVDSITWKPVIDSNSRAAVMQTGEAQFTYPLPVRAGRRAQGQARSRRGRRTVDLCMRYLSMNTHAEAVRRPERAPGDGLRHQQGGVRQGGLQWLCHARRTASCREGVGFAVKLGAWPYDVAKAKEAPGRGGLPERLRDRALVGVQPQHRPETMQLLQQQLQQIGVKAKMTLLEAGQRVEKVESWHGPGGPRPVRCITPAGRPRPAKPTGRLRPLLGSDAWPPKLFNTAYYKQRTASTRTSRARWRPPTRREKAKFYKDAQETVWKDAPWVPLVTEQQPVGEEQEADRGLYHARRSVDFTEIDLH